MALKDHIMPAPDDYDDRYIWNLPAQCMPTPDDYDHETTCSNTEGTISKRTPNNSTLSASYPSRERIRSQSKGDVYQNSEQVHELGIRDKLGNGLLGTLSTYLLYFPLKAQTILFMKWNDMFNGTNFNFDTCINEDFNGEEGQDFHSFEENKCTKIIAGCLYHVFSLLLGLKNTICVYLFFTLLGLTLGNSTSVEWNITSPIVFGEWITLEVFIPNILVESKNGTNTWRGGQDGQLISFDNVSSNCSKYEVKKMLSDKGSVHSLVIKDVNETDLNVNYTCQIGFTQFSTTLNLKDNVCVRLPNKNTIYKYVFIEGNRLNGQIVLDAVYPSPNCRFSQGTTLLDNIEIFRKETKTSIASIRVVFLFYESVVPDCGPIIMNCSFATIDMHEVLMVENCTVKAKEYKDKEQSDIILSVAGSCVVLAFIILVISLFIRRKKRKRESMRQSYKEDGQHDDEYTLRMVETLDDDEKKMKEFNSLTI